MEATHETISQTGPGGVVPAAAAAGYTPQAVPRVDWDALRSANRSCCCPARPAVVALMPPSPGRPHRTGLLLCMHHFRAGRRALAAAGANVLDMRRKLIDPAAPAYLTGPSEPARP